ncbi:MAG: DUF2079 domain-containing protein, partial [Archangium sp.]
MTQFASFNVGSYDMSLYHFAIRHLWSDGPGFAWAFGLERNFFSEHFSPVLFLFVPVDLLFRSSLALLVAQAVLVSLGVPLSAALARALGLPRAIGAVLALAYAFNASLWEAFRFDFHPETLVPVSVLAMSWCLARERFAAFAVTLLLALSIKEDMALVLVPCLFMLGLSERRVRVPAFLGAMVCVLWLLFAIGFAIPHAQPTEVAWSMFAARYGNWGAT